MSKILFLSSEAFPLIKTGGLADVAGSLPNALHKKQQDIRLCLPAYRDVLDKLKHTRVIATTAYYDIPVNIVESRLPGTQLTVWLVDCPALFDRPGGPYSNQHGHAWEDNALRFTVFCHCAVDIAMNTFDLDWAADLVHCNDWQTGLVPALLSLRTDPPKTLFTIHNLAYQGNFPAEIFSDLHLPQELWHINGVEFYGQFSFIKGGLACSTKINTVSPNYAKEICTDAHGYGMNGLLKHRASDLTGIINGIDTKYWNPGTDKYLVQKYNSRSLNKKALNKTALQESLNLPVDATCPMLGMVSRLVEQKGLEIILQSLDTLLEQNIQIVILGTGDTHYELQLHDWAQRFPERLSVNIGYDEAMAHRIEASSDIYLMPSRFEPCGLNQIYSLRYGTLPVVTEVGGLADTVIDAGEDQIVKSLEKCRANGFVLKEHSSEGLIDAVFRALALYAKTDCWRQLQNNAMRCDYSWDKSAEAYLELYQSMLSA